MLAVVLQRRDVLARNHNALAAAKNKSLVSTKRTPRRSGRSLSKPLELRITRLATLVLRLVTTLETRRMTPSSLVKSRILRHEVLLRRLCLSISQQIPVYGLRSLHNLNDRHPCTGTLPPYAMLPQRRAPTLWTGCTSLISQVGNVHECL